MGRWGAREEERGEGWWKAGRGEGGKGERRAGQDTHMSLKTPLNAAHQGSESSIDVTRDSNHFCGEEENGSVRTGPEHPVFS